MESSIDTIRRLANLTGIYSISDENAKNKTNIQGYGANSKGLTEDELKLYSVFPIIKIDTDTITYVKPDAVKYNKSVYVAPTSSKLTIPRSKITNPTGDDIVFICRDSYTRWGDGLASHDFWCESIDSKYIASFTEGTPLLMGNQGKYLWYYGKKIVSKGGRPRRRTTFRQRRLKRTTSKSRRATRRTRRV